jgi:RecA-family ATPase
MYKHDLSEVIKTINPVLCSYEEWVQVGMGLKAEGYTCAVWEDWSARDTKRWHRGECGRKWASFTPDGGITGGTVVEMARRHGWQPRTPDTENDAYDWDSEIVADNSIFDAAWVEPRETAEPDVWDPVRELTTYLDTLFSSEDYVGYVTQSYEKDGRFVPGKGNSRRTAGELIGQLGKCGGDISDVLGDYNPDVGAWIRFNPLDGQGIRNTNVTELRYALVESDDMPIEKQNAILRELNLPIACLVHSGGKSLHAIVKIDAKDYDEYRKRVDHLYDVCRASGFAIDTQNRNPSRLSRMPGVMRAGRKQYLLDTNIGATSWDEWREWYDVEHDIFPDISTFSDEVNLELAEPVCVVDGLLRPGDKMMMSGPSKAGKSFTLMELAIAVAEGAEWLGMQCTPGNVIYVNFELRRENRIRRMKKIYEALWVAPEHTGRIHSLDLKGQAAPIEALKSKIIRSVAKYRPTVIILDPIYKIMIGDENNARDVAEFCNILDAICVETGAAIVYCHHHSKGAQSSKQSVDRASGSGVFARDVDTLLDMIELHITDDMRGTIGATEQSTAWRIESTLREFARPAPMYITFNYPIHKIDASGVLEDAKKMDEYIYSEKKKKSNEDRSKEFADERKERIEAFRAGIAQATEEGDTPDKTYMAEFLSAYLDIEVSEQMVTAWRNKFKVNGEANFKADRKNGNGYQEIPF